MSWHFLAHFVADIVLGLCVRSVCWEKENIVVGTKDGEVMEITVADRDNPSVLVQVRVHETHHWCMHTGN